MPSYARKHQLQGNFVYHLLNRGGRRLFHEEEDYLFFKDIVLRYVIKEGLLIYHYSLIPNHYHFEVELYDTERISSIMAGINRSYTHYHHKKYKAYGYLWQGRFKSKPMQKNSYLLNCGRYIETNPVRAKMVKKAEDYAYSSAKYYVLGEKDEIVTENPLYEEFGFTAEERKNNYKTFLLNSKEDEANTEYCNFDKPLGDKEFKSRLCKKQGRWYPRRQGRAKGSDK